MPWETAVDRQARRRNNAEDLGNAAEDDRTNVGVIILQQCSLLPGWWACAEAKCSIGLAGRFTFSFASAGEPGPPATAQFGTELALPLLKACFRLVLQHLGPQAPLPTDSPLLAWSACDRGQEAVYRFRLMCSDLRRTLNVDETFASCLNKSGYWLASVSFWSSVLSQLWQHALGSVGHEAVVLSPTIPVDCLKLSMDFFTYRFLYGACVLSADIRNRTWTKKRPSTGTNHDRWNAAALLLLKGSCGLSINARVAERAGPMFRGLQEGKPCEHRREAEEAYRSALEYLRLRGFGEIVHGAKEDLPVFIKRHHARLPDSCRQQLRRAGVPSLLFGLHVLTNTPPADAELSCKGVDTETPQPLDRAQMATEEAAGPAQDNGPHPASSMPAIESNGPKPTPPKTSKAAPYIDSNGQNPTPFRKSEAPCKDRRDNARQAVARAALPKPDEASGTEDGELGQVLHRKTAPASCRDGATAALLEEDDTAAGTAAWKAPVADSASETKLPWEVLFDGEPCKAVENYTCLRSEVVQVLGARRDPGIYTFVDLGVEGPTRRLKAACKPEACKGCTRQLRASFRFGDAGPHLHVRARGKHGTLQKPSGGSLWTVAEEHMLANKSDEGAHVTAKMVRAAFKQANMPLRCTDAQLHAWVGRTRKKLSALPPKPKKFLAAEMYAAASPFIADIAQWRTQPLHKLIVLPNPVFQEERVCAIWTCPGMLRRAEAARNKVVKLAVDGKQKILCNNYSVLTLSFLVSSEHVTKTRDSRARVSSRPKVHTLTQEPFMQALVNSEAEENVAQFFTAACEIGAQCCRLDLKSQVWQVHKDYAKGIEAARRKVFPSARPCDDYPHMRRASYSVLKQKMGVTRVYGPQFFCVCASLHLTSGLAQNVF